jgi:hypothetical protein
MLNYIIASYDGNKLEYSLQIQLQVLYSLIMQGKLKHLSQVTIVCPKTKPQHKPHAFYYQKDMWLNLFEKTNIKLVYMDYVGENKTASYDQWIQAYLAYPDFEYFLFIEDDYCIHPSLSTFDSDLIDYYLEKTNGKDGYMCTLASELYDIEYHAAISNGIVNKSTMVRLGPNILSDYYQIAKHWDCQLSFSKLFKNKGIDIFSMHEKYMALFWSSYKVVLENFSKNTDNIFFIPVQFLFQCYFNFVNKC